MALPSIAIRSLTDERSVHGYAFAQPRVWLVSREGADAVARDGVTLLGRLGQEHAHQRRAAVGARVERDHP
jgi:hypothetical protein